VCCNILTHDDASSAIGLGFHVAGRGSSVPQAWTIGKYDHDHYANIADPISAHEAQEKITNILLNHSMGRKTTIIPSTRQSLVAE
jgi:hypothetical protein